jgi:sn-glycerol 3-phosphate transport system substrate-binding protein
MRAVHRKLGGLRRCEAEASSISRSARCPTGSDVEGAPQNTIIGGASLWVMQGQTDEEYKGVAAFLNFLSSPIQAKWHQDTGYLPITTGGLRG